MSKQGSRREFLKTSTAAGAVALAGLSNVHAQGKEVIRVGLIGCGSPRGGRGRGAAMQCLNAMVPATDSTQKSAAPNVVLYAMADMFKDHLDYTHDYIKQRMEKKVDVADDRKFTGFDAYKKVCALKEVDLVLLAAPPGFRPAHIQAAVEAGKHIFAEKPVATDAPGVRSVFKSMEVAKQKKLSVVSGLCWRYDHGMRATFDKIHNGGVGDIATLQCNYNTGGLWMIPRTSQMSDMEWQLRNWLYFTWLSGDHNVEQHIHSLDKMLWAMKDVPPVKCVGTGGRQVRTGDEYGHIFDHHAVIYDFPEGIRCFAMCRQQVGCKNETNDYVFGSNGTCNVMRNMITGKNGSWKAPKSKADRGMYQNEHDELMASILKGDPINNGDYMTKSTMMAIMGRMATYTGQEITWEQAMNSKEDLLPEKLELSASLPVPPVARPGVTKFF